MNGEPFPLDFNSLKRGDYLPAEAVEKATLTERRDPNYRIKSLMLRDSIREHFRTVCGDIVTVVSVRDGLRILTHQEQAEYAPQRESKAMRQIAVAQIEGRAVDLKQLSEEQRSRHERWMHRNSWRLQQLRKPPPPELSA